MTRLYRDKRSVVVDPYTTSDVIYGFLTNIKEADSLILGHIPFATMPDNAPVVFGANAPKPGRCTIERETETVNSFYDIGQRATLRAAGHRVTSPRNRTGRETNLAIPVFVTMPGGWKYAWYMRKAVYNRISADVAGLGIQLVTSSMTDLVWGANNVKPAKARKRLQGQDGIDVITTFIDEAQADDLPEGWTLVPSSNSVVLQ